MFQMVLTYYATANFTSTAWNHISLVFNGSGNQVIAIIKVVINGDSSH